jgi:hypothetical protein
MTASSQASTCNNLLTMSLRTGPLILHLWRPPKRNSQQKQKSKKISESLIITRTYDSLPTPESPLSTLIFLHAMRLEMSPFTLRLGHSPKRKLSQVKISESPIIARLPVTHPQSPRAQPVQPAITAQSCRRAIQSTIVTARYSQTIMIITGTSITTTTTL